MSIKLTQMGLDLGVEECLAVLEPVAAAGDRHGVFVRIDMEGSAYTERTLEVVRRLRAAGHDAGPVIQAYLHRSPDDVAALAAERVRTRICKGAYAEPPELALQEREAIGDAFVALVRDAARRRRLPGRRDPRPGHAAARDRGRRPPRACRSERYEFQMLHGVRRDLQRQLLADGHRLRIYVPYGTEWYPYFMRRLAERPANVWFVLRSVFGERS